MQRNKVTVTVKAELCIVVALTLFLIAWQWVAAWIAASVFHELCHYTAIRLCHRKILRIDVGLTGAIMETEELTPRQEAACAFAGPMGSGLLVLLAPLFPRVAICGLFHSGYNLLPIYPLDGGRILKGILGSVFSVETAAKIIKRTGNITILLLVLMGLYAYFALSLGPIPLLAATLLWLKIKIPCKQRRLRVQ